MVASHGYNYSLQRFGNGGSSSVKHPRPYGSGKGIYSGKGKSGGLYNQNNGSYNSGPSLSGQRPIWQGGRGGGATAASTNHANGSGGEGASSSGSSSIISTIAAGGGALQRTPGLGCGLRNLGNTCYLNSVLQVLTHCPNLVDAIVTRSHRSSCRCRNTDEFCVLCEVELHVLRARKAGATATGPVAPRRIVENIKRISPTFRQGTQEDAHEFLRLLVDHMQKSCKDGGSGGGDGGGGATSGGGAVSGGGAAGAGGVTARGGAGLMSGRLGGTGMATTATARAGAGAAAGAAVRAAAGGTAVAAVAAALKPYPFHLFAGAMQSLVTCTECRAESHTVDPMEDLGLEIDRTDINSVTDALRQFTKREVLDGANKYACERCKRRVRATKEFRILNVAPVLVIQLKHFQFAHFVGSSASKINKRINFAEELDMTPFITTKQQAIGVKAKCHLFALVVHLGQSANSGHYFAFVKSTRPGLSAAGAGGSASGGGGAAFGGAVGGGQQQWYRMDDQDVQPVSLATVLQARPYMLFYKSTTTGNRQLRQDGAVAGVAGAAVAGAAAAAAGRHSVANTKHYPVMPPGRPDKPALVLPSAPLPSKRPAPSPAATAVAGTDGVAAGAAATAPSVCVALAAALQRRPGWGECLIPPPKKASVSFSAAAAAASSMLPIPSAAGATAGAATEPAATREPASAAASKGLVATATGSGMPQPSLSVAGLSVAGPGARLFFGGPAVRPSQFGSASLLLGAKRSLAAATTATTVAKSNIAAAAVNSAFVGPSLPPPSLPTSSAGLFIGPPLPPGFKKARVDGDSDDDNDSSGRGTGGGGGGGRSSSRKASGFLTDFCGPAVPPPSLPSLSSLASPPRRPAQCAAAAHAPATASAGISLRSAVAAALLSPIGEEAGAPALDAPQPAEDGVVPKPCPLSPPLSPLSPALAAASAPGRKRGREEGETLETSAALAATKASRLAGAAEGMPSSIATAAAVAAVSALRSDAELARWVDSLAAQLADFEARASEDQTAGPPVKDDVVRALERDCPLAAWAGAAPALEALLRRECRRELSVRMSAAGAAGPTVPSPVIAAETARTVAAATLEACRNELLGRIAAVRRPFENPNASAQLLFGGGWRDMKNSRK